MQGHLLQSIKSFEARLASIKNDVARGAPIDYAKYQHKVGAIAELERVVEELKACHHKMFQGETA